MARNEIEVIEVPEPCYAVAQRRMKPFVEYTAANARWGTLDLLQLACSAYLQGAYDAFEGLGRREAESRKSHMEALNEFDKAEWWDVFRQFKPEATRDEFESAWAEFTALKHARMEALQLQ